MAVRYPPEVESNPLLLELARLPARFAALLDGRSEAELRRGPAPDAWSAKEIAGHLRDIDGLLNST